MQVNIKKDGKKKSYNLINSWDDVTLEKWAKLINGNKSKTKEALDTITMLSDIPRKLVKELSINDVSNILNKIAELQNKAKSRLKKIIKVEGVEYGFHPDLSEITLGEYADIETYIQAGIENNLAKMMAVLYRPIVEKNGKYYTIKRYEGSEVRMRAEKFKKMKAIDVNSCLVFFWTLGNELSTILPLYLMDRMKELKLSLQMKSSQRSGDGSE
mgnify:FL=1|tara:strand:- start:1030 stop:1671 length:642 start_codon:yes stop_codon:yes gene_type:complete